METNAKIVATALTGDRFAIQLGTAVQNAEATATVTFDTTAENVNRILQLSDAACWEQLIGKAVRIRLEQVQDNYQVKAIGHLLIDSWISISIVEETVESDTEED